MCIALVGASRVSTMMKVEEIKEAFRVIEAFT
jgi:hypothetical protein